MQLSIHLAIVVGGLILGVRKPELPEYRVAEVPCYIVSLCAVVDADGNLVSDPYGVGAWDDLKDLANAWNESGYAAGSEDMMVRAIRARELRDFYAKGGRINKNGIVVLKDRNSIPLHTSVISHMATKPTP